LSCLISVVVVAYRQRAALVECLSSCVAAAAQVPGEVELILVDNGGLARLVREEFPLVTVIESGSNIGFAAGVNRGVAASTGTWVALVNDDAVIEREALASALAAGEQELNIGAVACQVRFQSAPGVINSAGISVDSIGVASERLAGLPVEAARAKCEVFGASGCFALYRTDMIEGLGGLAERFFAYQEDVDLAWRSRAAGWRTVYEPGAVCYHRASASSGRGSAMKYWLVGRNRVWLLARNATRAQLARAAAGILAYDIAYVGYVAVRDRTLAPLRGRIAGLRTWSEVRSERANQRRPVELAPATRAWRSALRMDRAYRAMAAPRPNDAARAVIR
jgi:GT2 family glycosyltransferase